MNTAPLTVTQPVTLELIDPIGTARVDERTVIHDLGQNIAGWARLTVSGPAGSVVTLRFGERLEDGRLYVANLRSARAKLDTVNKAHTVAQALRAGLIT